MISYFVVCVILGLAIFVELRLVTVWQTDRQTDERTNDDSIYRASIASCGKSCWCTRKFLFMLQKTARAKYEHRKINSRRLHLDLRSLRRCRRRNKFLTEKELTNHRYCRTISRVFINQSLLSSAATRPAIWSRDRTSGETQPKTTAWRKVNERRMAHRNVYPRDDGGNTFWSLCLVPAVRRYDGWPTEKK